MENLGTTDSKGLDAEVPESSRMIAGRSGTFLKALLLLCAFSVIRIIIIAKLPLTGDEAYYWQWSRHLALGYHDHPPLVGWIIRAGTIFGDSAFWVRFPSLLLSFLTGMLVYFFTRDAWQSEKKAFQSVLLLLSIPIFSICALAAFPDGPLVFSWALFLWGSWRWLADERAWPWMGIALGLAALSKLMGLFIFPSFLLFLLISDKTKLARTSLWKSVGLALLLTLPFLLWNSRHGFETFTYQIHQRLSRGVSFSPSLFLNYTSLQLVALSPLLFFIILFTLGMLFRKSMSGDLRARFALCMALPIHLFFLGISWFTRVGLHWALPGYLSIVSAVPVWVDEMIAKQKTWGLVFYRASLAVSLAITFFFFTLFLRPEVMVPWISSLGIRHQGVNQGKTLTSQAIGEILGYQELGSHVRTLLAKWGHVQLIIGRVPISPISRAEPFVFTDSYSLSSVISFYANVDAKTLLFTSTGGDYDRWNHFEEWIGHDALYVDTQPIGSRPDIDQVLHRGFAKIVPLTPLTVKRGSAETDTFYFARCERLAHPEALRPVKSW